MKKYFVNVGNLPRYIMADFVSIKNGYLIFWATGEPDTIIEQFKIHAGLYFDSLNNSDK